MITIKIFPFSTYLAKLLDYVVSAINKGINKLLGIEVIARKQLSIDLLRIFDCYIEKDKKGKLTAFISIMAKTKHESKGINHVRCTIDSIAQLERFLDHYLQKIPHDATVD